MNRQEFEERWNLDEGDIETAASYGCPACGERFCTETERGNFLTICCEECGYEETHDWRLGESPAKWYENRSTWAIETHVTDIKVERAS